MDTAIVLFTRDLRQTPWQLPARERPGYPGPMVELS